MKFIALTGAFGEKMIFNIDTIKRIVDQPSPEQGGFKSALYVKGGKHAFPIAENHEEIMLKLREAYYGD